MPSLNQNDEVNLKTLLRVELDIIIPSYKYFQHFSD